MRCATSRSFQKRPNLLSHKIKNFFCKYNDPIFVKMEKLEILVSLANATNVDSLLLELKEYATEVDVEYVRRAVRTIGRCAIKLEVAAERCIKVLLQLIATRVNYVVQEAIVVIKDIFRRYPNRYESIIGVLCGALDTLDEPEAKASMIWIIGEYADRIDNAGELLEAFTTSFHDETTAVQLQLLTATVKLFLKRPAESETLVQNVLSAATENSDNPDLRDRGYIYWRLLSTDPDAAKSVVLAERPVIQDDTSALEPALLDVLIRNLSNLASVYHKPPEAFVRRARAAGAYDEDAEARDDDDGVGYGDDEVTGTEAEVEARATAAGAAATSAVADDDLLGIGAAPAAAASSAAGGAAAAAAAPVAAAGGAAATAGSGASAAAGTGGALDDLFFGGGGSAAPAPAAPAVPSLPELGSADGITARGAFVRRGGRTYFDFVLDHTTGAGAPITATALKFNKSVLGVSPTAGTVTFAPIPVGRSGYLPVEVSLVPALVAPAAALPAGAEVVQAALRDNASGRVMYFNIPLAYGAFFAESAGAVDVSGAGSTWKAVAPGSEGEHADIAKECATVDPEAVKARLAAKNIQFVTARPGPDASLSMAYYVAKAPDAATGTAGATTIAYELTFKTGLPAIKVVARTHAPAPTAKLATAAMKAALAP